MKQGIIMGCDITKVDEEYTTASACKFRKRQGIISGEIVVLDILRVKPNDPDRNRKLREFAFHWHPNLFRRWLFRLLRI